MVGQTPLAWQVAAFVAVPFAQLPARQTTEASALRQTAPPVPWQPPGEQTAFSAVPAGQIPFASWPAGTLVQVPRVVGRLHDSQPAWQALSQQTPSAQKVVAHSCPFVQLAPA